MAGETNRNSFLLDGFHHLRARNGQFASLVHAAASPAPHVGGFHQLCVHRRHKREHHSTSTSSFGLVAAQVAQ
jgi:hypothetical protein